MKLKPWTALRKGDIVDVVAPGFASKPEVVEGARKFLLHWGLVPRIPTGLIAPHFLHSNEDAERFKFLKNGLLAEDSAAVWCMRGGYGSNRLVPFLAKVRKPRRPKLFIGISDVTSLHVFLNQEWGWPTLHGPLLDRLGRGELSMPQQRELKKLLFGELDGITFKGLRPLNDPARKLKRLSAPITGGNLVTFASTLATPWQIDLRGKFLFIEEIGERGYRVDRLFEHLNQAGVMKGCKGVLFGDFMGGEEEDGRNLGPAVIARWAKQLPIPVFAGLPAGHADIQRPVPLGTVATLQAGSSFKLFMPSGGIVKK